MTYKEKTETPNSQLVERLALILSKRLDRADLAVEFFGEMKSSSGASHAVLWRRDQRSSSIFYPDLFSCEISKDERFDAAKLAEWEGWQSDHRAVSSLESERQVLPWTQHNYILPLFSNENHVLGLLSLHYPEEPEESAKVLSPFLGQLTFNALLSGNREPSRALALELWIEHHQRLLLSRIHSRLDRDHVLQSSVDTLGSILKVSSCLILRLEPGAAAKITHEYVEPDLSPLGLGGSMFIPELIAAQMCERTTILEETGIRKHEQGKYIVGMETLFESSIRSLAGTPINMHSTSFGALVVQSDKVRIWQKHELQLLENTANVVSIALKNAELYQEAKEQVFNLNLVSNLTRQLSSAVEQLSKGPMQHEPLTEDQINPQEVKVPLSARELEVLRLIASGLANREIAQRLFLTESTVELHASRIRKKLKLKSRTALVKFACDNHLV